MKQIHFWVLIGLAVVCAAEAHAETQEWRGLPLSALYLSASGDSSWLKEAQRLDVDVAPGLDLQGLGASSFDQDKELDFNLDRAGADPRGEYQAYVKMDRQVGRVFNLSLAVAMLKQPGQPSGAAVSKDKFRLTSPMAPALGESLAEDVQLWAVSAGVDWRVFKRQGVHLGYMYGVDPLTGLAQSMPASPGFGEKQSFDLGYIYDLNGLYLSLGYVYSIQPDMEGEFKPDRSETQTTDSAVYLRFQLRF